ILKTNENVNRKLGFNFGMTHSEYMVTKDKEIYLIESANRGGGVYTSAIIVPNVTNIDIVEQYICDSLKIEKNYFKDDIKENSVVLKFFSLPLGKIKEINGIADFEKKEEILKLRLSLKKGDVVQKITTDANRHGFVIARNDTINLGKEIAKHIRICYEK
ncbi:MAG: ATP-dependent carboxylate-amine ligase, partial [Epsilonproteobacteria bacterium]|nr:ATP-dependent carboxylate-amine ligase [Campylobacterota bacterium]